MHADTFHLARQKCCHLRGTELIFIRYAIFAFRQKFSSQKLWTNGESRPKMKKEHQQQKKSQQELQNFRTSKARINAKSLNCPFKCGKCFRFPSKNNHILITFSNVDSRIWYCDDGQIAFTQQQFCAWIIWCCSIFTRKADDAMKKLTIHSELMNVSKSFHKWAKVTMKRNSIQAKNDYCLILKFARKKMRSYLHASVHNLFLKLFRMNSKSER